jgi:hypothetical protein
MEFRGKVVSITPIVNGQSARGLWHKQDVIFEQKQNHRKICVTFLNKSHIVSNLVLNNEYDVFFDFESKQYNGKWYTNILAWKVIDNTGSMVGSKIRQASDSQNDEIKELYDFYKECIEEETELMRHRQIQYEEDEMIKRFERQREEDERRELLSTGNIYDASEAFGHNAWALNYYLSKKNK